MPCQVLQEEEWRKPSIADVGPEPLSGVIESLSQSYTFLLSHGAPGKTTVMLKMLSGVIKSGRHAARPGETVKDRISNQWHSNGGDRFREIRGIRGQ